MLAAKRVNVDYVPILASHNHELIAYHTEASAPHHYFSEHTGPSMEEVSESLESTWELGQLVRSSVAQDLSSLGDAQVFLPLHPSELADESIYSGNDNLLARMRERILLSIAEDDFIGDSDPAA
ncbi:MAG: hypothetical protein GY811_01125 [Myxococcales bacterium]|nr:hypothetical protein [Myxococcales bacterium]